MKTWKKWLAGAVISTFGIMLGICISEQTNHTQGWEFIFGGSVWLLLCLAMMAVFLDEDK